MRHLGYDRDYQPLESRLASGEQGRVEQRSACGQEVDEASRQPAEKQRDRVCCGQGRAPSTRNRTVLMIALVSFSRHTCKVHENKQFCTCQVMFSGLDERRKQENGHSPDHLLRAASSYAATISDSQPRSRWRTTAAWPMHFVESLTSWTKHKQSSVADCGS